eukprot:1571228-Pleurochrysis_carterae.AAC.2
MDPWLAQLKRNGHAFMEWLHLCACVRCMNAMERECRPFDCGRCVVNACRCYVSLLASSGALAAAGGNDGAR